MPPLSTGKCPFLKCVLETSCFTSIVEEVKHAKWTRLLLEQACYRVITRKSATSCFLGCKPRQGSRNGVLERKPNNIMQHKIFYTHLENALRMILSISAQLRFSDYTEKHPLLFQRNKNSSKFLVVMHKAKFPCFFTKLTPQWIIGMR